MTSAASIALSGMNAAQTGLQVSAHNIANLNTDGFRRQQVEQAASAGGGVSTTLSTAAWPGESLADDIVGQLESKNAFLANLAVFKATNRMMGTLLDITS